MTDQTTTEPALLFPADPFVRRQPDEVYAAEAAAAEQLGLFCALLDFEALVDDGDASRAIRWLPERSRPAVQTVYRGWMLRPERYDALYEALAARGYRLVNTPAQYALTHQLPNWYSLLADWTPCSVWMSADDALVAERRAMLLGDLGAGPLIVKDYVKSQKHAWDEACFIPDAQDQTQVSRVVRRFLELQGPDLNDGLVFRRFEAFRAIGRHARSGMPISREYRLFMLDGEPITVSPYWEEQDDDAEAPPSVDWVTAAVSAVGSRFFSVDIAERTDGVWRIVELGDGQVAGRPDTCDPRRLLEAIRTAP